MSRRPTRTRPGRPAPRGATTAPVAVLTTVLTTVLLLAATACSGGDDAPGDGPSGRSGAPTETAVATRAGVGAVAGDLRPGERARTARRVAAAVDRWWERAYLGGEYPREDFSDALADFTPAAARQARGRLGLLSNAAIGARLTGVEALERRVVVDLAATGQQAFGATARVDLLMRLTADDVEREDRVTGRVLLTPSGNGWRVFGYDLRRETVR